MTTTFPIKQSIKDSFAFVFLPLLLGVFIYYYTRPHSIYFLRWIDTLIQSEKIFKIELPYWVVYHLPDGLWAFAFISFLLIIWERKVSKKNIIWLLMPLISAVLLEVSYGTFDFIDLCFVIIGGSLPLLFIIVIQIFKYEQ